jgi:hypothetical protein
VFRFSLVSVIAAVYHTHIHLNITHIRTSGRILGTVKQSDAFSNVGSRRTE